MEDNATRRGAWISDAFMSFPFQQLMVEKPASHTVDMWIVEGNGALWKEMEAVF